MSDLNVPPELPGLRFITKLGSGGYSEVYLYEQQRPRMNVAVKVLTRPDLTDEARRQFTAEGDAMATLADHPSIVQVFNADIAADGRPYLVMKYYPNPNLGVRARSERLSVAEALRIGIEISSAVETAHRAGILHRDIKPANILISQFGAAGLTDFGIAASTMNASGADGLSVPWSPPEVLFSNNTPDVRSDVYSLAATTWHLLVGRSPFEIPGGDNQSVALMRRILEQPPPRTGRADVPDSLDRLLQQAMAKQAPSRPPSALALARGLQAIEQEQRLPLTQIVVPPSAQQVARGATQEEGPATRIKTPTRLQAQGPTLPPAPQHTDPNASWQRPPEGNGFGLPPQPPNKSQRKRWAVIAVVAVVVALAAIVGVVITGGNSDSSGKGSGSGTVHQSGSPIFTPPTQPVVQAKPIAAGRYQFTWTYSNKAAKDYALWHTQQDQSGAGHHGTAPANGPLVLNGAIAKLCVVVTIVSGQNGQSSPPAEPSCPG